MTLAVHTGAGTLPIVAHGTEEQRLRLVPPLAQGHELAAFALTESGSGSDAAAMRTRRRRADRLTARSSGSRTAATPTTFTVFARDARPAGARARSSCAAARRLPRRPRGGEARAALLPTADLAFEATPGRAARRAAGAGMRIALATLDGGRIGIAAQAVGIAQAALDVAVAYARSAGRSAVPIGGPGDPAEARGHETEIEAARALTWRAARLKDAGRPHTVEGAQAKLFASRRRARGTGEAIQVLGGSGYTREFPAERYYRDAKVTEIYEGTSEIQRLVIARALLGDVAPRHRRLSPRPPRRATRTGAGRG